MKIIRWCGSALFALFGGVLLSDGLSRPARPDLVEGSAPKIRNMLFGALPVVTGIVLAVDTYRKGRQ